MITLHGIKTCNTVRQARRWLDASGLEYRFRDFRESPPTAAELSAWIEQCGWQTLLNRRSTTWKALPADEREAVASAETAATLLAAHPTLIKRPVLTGAAGIHVGFDPGRYHDLLASH